jgi:hypothetical protein
MNEESLKYLENTYPTKVSELKNNFELYKKEVMGNVKTYIQNKNSLVFKRSQEDLFIFGFYSEACIVSRIVLEDFLKRYFNKQNKKLETIINEALENENKELAKIIQKNGNDCAHELWNKNSEIQTNKEKKMALESAKALNQLLVNLGAKTPEY